MKLDLDGRVFDFLVDTGADASLLEREGVAAAGFAVGAAAFPVSRDPLQGLGGGLATLGWVHASAAILARGGCRVGPCTSRSRFAVVEALPDFFPELGSGFLSPGVFFAQPARKIGVMGRDLIFAFSLRIDLTAPSIKCEPRRAVLRICALAISSQPEARRHASGEDPRRHASGEDPRRHASGEDPGDPGSNLEGEAKSTSGPERARMSSEAGRLPIAAADDAVLALTALRIGRESAVKPALSWLSMLAGFFGHSLRR